MFPPKMTTAVAAAVAARNFDPAQMQQRIMSNVRDQLGFTNDTEWNAIQPMVQKVMDARRDVGFGGMGRLFGRGNRGGNNNADVNNGGRRGGFGGTPSPEAEALQKAIDDNAPTAQIKAALAKYKASQKAKQAKLVQAQENLRKVLTIRNRKPRPPCSDCSNNKSKREADVRPMNETPVQAASLKPLLDRMVAGRQLSATDAESLARAKSPAQTEEDILRWLAQEYGLAYTTLDDVDPDRQLLSLFPARILLKEELLPLKRLNGTVEVATSRLFATQGLDALKTMTGLNLKPVLASSEAIQREIKKRLGVGADTIGTLDEEKGFQVVDENAEDTNLDEAEEDEASIIRFVNQVLKDAIELRASDIHLEPFEDEFRIRYRIDGRAQSR